MTRTATDIKGYLDAKHEAVRTDWWVRAVSLLGAAILIVAAGLVLKPINAVRKEAQLTLDPETLSNMPPDIALMTKTGTFRGLAINMAFIRLEKLKEANRFHELMQLSDWLCKLAPQYPSVWSYSAWNMAYNISVTQYTPESRWLWVSNGIDNLRLRGLKYNPRSITLYKELAYIFWHKIGDKLDDNHDQYKRELAVQMEVILGEPPPAMTAEQAVAEFREIAEAPTGFVDIMEVLSDDPETAQLYHDLQALGLKADKSLLEFVARNIRSHTDDTSLVASEAKPPSRMTNDEKRLAILTDPARQKSVRRLLAIVRHDVLKRELNMDPAWMLKLMTDPPWLENVRDQWIAERGPDSIYCPIDWRSPFAHSLYWGTYGDWYTKKKLNINPNDSMNAVRFIFFSLKNLAEKGRIILEPNFDKPNRSFLQMLPDPRFYDHMHEAYLKYGAEQFGDDPRFVKGTSGPNYASGHRNFLMDAIRQLYIAGGEKNLEHAKRYFFYLRETHRNEDGSIRPQYQMPFDKFVLSNMYEKLDTQAATRALVSEMLYRSLTDLADGQVDKSVAHFREAKRWWNYYHRDMKTDRNTRRMLEPIGVMRRDVVRDFMATPPWGGRTYSLLQKHRVWTALDLQTRQAVYDDILPYVKAACEQHDPPYDVDKMIPVPPGMEEYRKNPDPILKELERLDPDVSQGEKKTPEQ